MLLLFLFMLILLVLTYLIIDRTYVCKYIVVTKKEYQPPRGRKRFSSSSSSSSSSYSRLSLSSSSKSSSQSHPPKSSPFRRKTITTNLQLRGSLFPMLILPGDPTCFPTFFCSRKTAFCVPRTTLLSSPRAIPTSPSRRPFASTSSRSPRRSKARFSGPSKSPKVYI